ncbi:unnamed protein product [Orchesella dallaii]|uniref:TAF5-like RNA polymerase II p300/CBP-associated factor-associated factor 65 kDa subunit 5L n=1 Tax=Orchesella dallaii TaxID=48710 RepID=A0ABP1PZF5_9HEXA
MLPIARRMYVEFSKKFMLEDKTQEHYDILVALMKISSPDIFKTDSSFKLLINRRYEFVLSEITIVYLRRFLSYSNHPIFVDLFTDRFKIRNRESKELIESIDWETLMDSEGAEPEANIDDDCDSVLSDASYKEHKSHVRIVIDELRNSSIANLPAISVYTTCDEPICGAVSKEGTLMAYGLAEAGIRIFAVDQAQDVLKPSENAEAELDVDDVKYACGHDGTVYGLHFHPKTKLLFSVGEDSLMRAWDLNTESPHCRAVYRGHTGPVWKLDIAKSGSIVATAGLDTTARIFVPERNEFVRMMVGHYFSVNCVKIHPNDTYLATGSADKSVRLWSINDGNISRILTGVAGTVHAIAFHSSGKYLAGAGEGCKIVIWDLAEGEAVATLESLPNCKDLTFNGSMLTAGYRNGMLQIYNLIPLLGGSNVREFNTPPSISPPYTCPTFAETVFKCYYKNPGMLFCMGSDLKVEHQERRKIQQEVCINPCNETDTGATHLHKVLQNKSTNNDDGVGSDTADSKFSSSSMGTIGSGRILAARLSQPLLSSAADEIGPVIESTNGNKTGLSTDPPSSRYRSSLDEAISSVIDQASESCIGSGTITMYASN